jgi:hypothetical protein
MDTASSRILREWKGDQVVLDGLGDINHALVTLPYMLMYKVDAFGLYYERNSNSMYTVDEYMIDRGDVEKILENGGDPEIALVVHMFKQAIKKRDEMILDLSYFLDMYLGDAIIWRIQKFIPIQDFVLFDYVAHVEVLMAYKREKHVFSFGRREWYAMPLTDKDIDACDANVRLTR